VIYPTEQQIHEFFANLPPDVREELELLIEAAQPEYRRARREDVANEAKAIEILARHAGEVFRLRTTGLLKARVGSFDEFRRAISLVRGEAETACWSAHRLYNLVETDRMLAVWHREIESHLRDRIKEAEDLWYIPDLVLAGWEKFFFGVDGASAAPPGGAGAHGSDATATIDRAIAREKTQAPDNADLRDRRAQVDAFIGNCLRETGVKITRTMIWRSAGYRSRSEFERWQANSPRATKQSAVTFARMLAMAPAQFVALLKKHHLLH
jgi:hypothetical protein